MPPSPHSLETATTGEKNVISYEELISILFQELDGRVSQERLRQVVTQVAAQYRDVTITDFIPILLRRKVRDLLTQELRMSEEIDKEDKNR